MKQLFHIQIRPDGIWGTNFERVVAERCVNNCLENDPLCYCEAKNDQATTNFNESYLLFEDQRAIWILLRGTIKDPNSYSPKVGFECSLELEAEVVTFMRPKNTNLPWFPVDPRRPKSESDDEVMEYRKVWRLTNKI